MVWLMIVVVGLNFCCGLVVLLVNVLLIMSVGVIFVELCVMMIFVRVISLIGVRVNIVWWLCLRCFMCFVVLSIF